MKNSPFIINFTKFCWNFPYVAEISYFENFLVDEIPPKFFYH